MQLKRTAWQHTKHVKCNMLASIMTNASNLIGAAALAEGHNTHAQTDSVWMKRIH